MYFVVFPNELCNLQMMCKTWVFVCLFQEDTFCIRIFIIPALTSVDTLSVDTNIGQIEWRKRPNDENDD